MQMASQTLPQNNLNKAKKGAEDKNKRKKKMEIWTGAETKREVTTKLAGGSI